jgi:hypothetical protein
VASVPIDDSELDARLESTPNALGSRGVCEQEEPPGRAGLGLGSGYVGREENLKTALSSLPTSSVMHLKRQKTLQDPDLDTRTNPPRLPLAWDWTLEHEDRKKERKVDAALNGLIPFEVDRKLLKDVVREKMGIEVARITFISSGISFPSLVLCRYANESPGTFHKVWRLSLFAQRGNDNV